MDGGIHPTLRFELVDVHAVTRNPMLLELRRVDQLVRAAQDDDERAWREHKRNERIELLRSLAPLQGDDMPAQFRRLRSQVPVQFLLACHGFLHGLCSRF